MGVPEAEAEVEVPQLGLEQAVVQQVGHREDPPHHHPAPVSAVVPLAAGAAGAAGAAAAGVTASSGHGEDCSKPASKRCRLQSASHIS